MNAVMRTLLLAALVLVIACEDQEDQADQSSTVDAEIKNTEIYEYHTGMGGDEQGASITQQARHYSISEIVRDASTNYEPVYRYKSAPGFVGTEEVKLTLSEYIIGATIELEATEITISITVTN